MFLSYNYDLLNQTYSWLTINEMMDLKNNEIYIYFSTFGDVVKQ